jgi:hypothetical protein
MVQRARVVDITQSYIPVDPATFPNTLHGTQLEDSPTTVPTVAPYDGYNFLPTVYGYKSYFGTNTDLGVDALESRCDKILMLQTETLENILVALCEDGIWIKQGETSGEWTHAAEEEIPTEEQRHYNWTWALMGEELFCYRASSPQVWRLSPKANLLIAFADPGSVSISYYDVVQTAGSGVAGTFDQTATYAIRYKNSEGLWTSKWQASSAHTVEDAFSTEAIFDLPEEPVDAFIYKKIGNQWYRTENVTIAADKVSVAEPSPATVWIEVEEDDSEDFRQDFDTPPYTPVAQVPTFLNMAGQQGIFRAGQRLGFWDSENSIAWSTIDDFTDFTPSIQTLAGSAIFGDVVGQIVVILPHGEGFIIYATKSIVWVRKATEATFQWDPKTILSNAGIAYLSQACSSTPDTVHFAWTSAGFYKIEDGREEVLVPGFWDWLSKLNTVVYLDVLEGRYLFISVLDENLIFGNAEFTVHKIPPSKIVIPVEKLKDTIEGWNGDYDGGDLCFTYGSMGNHVDKDAEVAAAAQAAGKPAPRPKSYQPVWTCYFSYSNLDPSEIEWSSTPCGSTDFDGAAWAMSPDRGRVSQTVTQDTTGKIGIQMNLDGPTFVATQLMLWELMDKRREAFLQEVLSRAFFDQKVSQANTPLNPPTFTVTKCDVGVFPKDFSAPYVGYSACSMWVTRYMTSQVDVKAKTTYRASTTPNENVAPLPGSYSLSATSQVIVSGKPSPAAAVPGDAYDVWQEAGGIMHFHYPPNGFSGVAVWGWNCPTGYTASGSTSTSTPPVCVPNQPYTKTETKGCQNVGEVQSTAPTADTGFAVLTHWKYIDVNGDEQIVPATNACNVPGYKPSDDAPNKGNGPGPIPEMPGDKTLCGKPFDPIPIPELDIETSDWPTATITIPGGQFLLQQGSTDPVYPTKVGAFVYDQHLKKWGKFKGAHKVLFDYAPINGSDNNTVPYDRFGIEAGILDGDGKIWLFDEWPADSKIKYGKVGYTRLGFTDLHEVKYQFAAPCSGGILVEASLDGRAIENALSEYATFDSILNGVLYYKKSARWYSISITGNYDIQHLEVRATQGGRR